MTPEQIDALTLGEVRAICERAAETLAKARDVLSLFGGGGLMGNGVIRPSVRQHVVSDSPAAPFPCAMCGRQSPELPGETCQATECQVCGNHLPAVGRVTNKGVLPPLTPEEKAKRMSLPAFDENGDPT